MVVNAFYENVPKQRAEHRELALGEKEESLVLEFRPNPAHDMFVACLWNHHKGNESGEGELFSFAAITDEPPPEVLAAGHDRCIIPIKRENVDAWLNPDPGELEASIEPGRPRPSLLRAPLGRLVWSSGQCGGKRPIPVSRQRPLSESL